ncbi:MAG TPA: hypothetical protein VIS07_09490 [Candidatus Binatia bacterium]
MRWSRAPRRAPTLLAAALGATLLAAPSLAASEPAAFFDYLHVEANEGSASGGHAAIRFGDETYHFQYHPEGVLRLHRDDADGFLHVYGGLQNRDVHVQRVRVAPETATLLRRRFNHRFLLEEQQFALLDALRADRDLLAAQAAGSPPVLAVPGAGLFASALDADAAACDDAALDRATLAALRARIEEQHGDLLARRARETRRALAELRPVVAAPPEDVAPHRYPASAPSLAQRTIELLAAEAALDVLQHGAVLEPRVVRATSLPETALAADEIEALHAWARQLETQLVALAASSRPDWGVALLLGMARLATLARSIASGQLVVLDAYPEDATVLPEEHVRAHAQHLPALLDDARADLTAARRALVATGGVPEAKYTALETATNRFLELHDATLSGAPLRVAPGPLLPGRSAPRQAPTLETASKEQLGARLAALEASLARYEARLREVYAYDLVRRNCVSEIFREIALALDDEGDGGVANVRSTNELRAPSCAGSRARLGGCVAPDEGLHFIPFVSARAVASEYDVAASLELPSYRRARLEEMYAQENDLLVFLRESNVLTSTVYEPNDEDSAFLFFTDDAGPLRPLFGALNLAAGLGAGAVGLALLPAGETDLVVAGLRGALFSVPELAFVSLRKGSFAYVPRTPRVEPLAADAASPSASSSSGAAPLREQG